MWFESHDLAHAMACMSPVPSKCTTAAAVRARVRMGHMHPDDWTARGSALWTAGGVTREVAHERRLQLEAIRMGIKDANTSILLQRREGREPRQLSFAEVA